MSQCYFPNGQISPDDTPCNPTVSVSSCCDLENSFCLDNGMCYGSGVVIRGSCTDQDWGPACPQVCKDWNTFERAALQPCNYLLDAFVCGTNTSGCIDNEDVFTLDNATSFLLPRWQCPGTVDSDTRSEPVVVNPSSTIQLDFSSQTAGLNAPDKGVKDVKSFTPQLVGGAMAATATPLLLALCYACIVIQRLHKKLHRTEAQLKTLESNSRSDDSSPLAVGNAGMRGMNSAPVNPGVEQFPASTALLTQLCTPTDGPREADPELEIREMPSQQKTQELSTERAQSEPKSHELEAKPRRAADSGKWWWKDNT